MKKQISLILLAATCLSLTGCSHNNQKPKPAVNPTVAKRDNRVNPQAVIKRNLNRNNYVKSYRMTNIKQVNNKNPSSVSYCLGNVPMNLATYLNKSKKPVMYIANGVIYMAAKNNSGKTVWLKQESENKAQQTINNNAKTANQYMNTLANPTLANLAEAKKTDSGYEVQIKNTKSNLKQIATQYQAKKNVKLVEYSLKLNTDKKFNLTEFQQVMAYSYKGKTQKQVLMLDQIGKFDKLSVPSSVTKHAIDQSKVRVK